MLKTFTSVVFILLTACSVYAQAKSSPTSNLGLSYVRESDFGCGCSLSYDLSGLRNRKHLFISPMDQAAYINLDGKNVKLRLIAASKEKAEERVGNRSWEAYGVGNVRVRIEYVVTQVCDPGDEACEVTYYRAKMIVSRGRQSKVVKGIALCGC